MGHGSVGDRQWHKNTFYPALSAEAAGRLQEKLHKLSAACDALSKSNYEQECRILELEAHVKYLERLKTSYEGLIVAKVGYATPQPEPEPFSY